MNALTQMLLGLVAGELAALAFMGAWFLWANRQEKVARAKYDSHWGPILAARRLELERLQNEWDIEFMSTEVRAPALHNPKQAACYSDSGQEITTRTDHD